MSKKMRLTAILLVVILTVGMGVIPLPMISADPVLL